MASSQEQHARHVEEQEQQQKPVTYGDVFHNLQGDVAHEPVSKLDASLMQKVETAVSGQTQPGGAASAMQSAADKNFGQGKTARDARTLATEGGMEVHQEVHDGGDVIQKEYVAGQQVRELHADGACCPGDDAANMSASSAFAKTSLQMGTPTHGVMTSEVSPVSIGAALENVVQGEACNTPLSKSDARAIQSAETRATGSSEVQKGGLGASAASNAAINAQSSVRAFERTTLGDALRDASSQLPCDKFVTKEDAEKVRDAELRGLQASEEIKPGGVSQCLQAAAEFNESLGGNVAP